LKSSGFLLILAVGLTLTHQVSALAALMVMVAVVGTPWALRLLPRTALRTNNKPRSLGTATLVFAVVLVGYWFLISFSMSGFVAHMNYVFATGQPVALVGYQLNLHLILGYAILLAVNGALGLYVLWRVLVHDRHRESGFAADALALVVTSGLFVIMGFALPRLGVGLDIFRLLLFIQVLVPIAFLTCRDQDKPALQKHDRYATERAPSIPHQASSDRGVLLGVGLVMILVIGNLVLLPPHITSPSVPPDFAGAEFRVYISPSEVAAVYWLPNGRLSLGDHYLSMASLYLDHGLVWVNQDLLLHSSPGTREYQWFLYDTSYKNVILDRCNKTFANLAPGQMAPFDSSPSLSKPYDNGNVWMYTNVVRTPPAIAPINLAC
jgi:hypothetical protein